MRLQLISLLLVVKPLNDIKTSEILYMHSKKSKEGYFVIYSHYLNLDTVNGTRSQELYQAFPAQFDLA